MPSATLPPLRGRRFLPPWRWAPGSRAPIRRPGRRQVGDGAAASWPAGPRAASPGCGFGSVSATAPDLTERDLKELRGRNAAVVRYPAAEPVFLVCTHGKRSVCCARLAGRCRAGARRAASRARSGSSTHVGGHRFAANLVILPHGLYYGPVGLSTRPPPRSRTSGARSCRDATGAGLASEADTGGRARPADSRRVAAAHDTGVTGLRSRT